MESLFNKVAGLKIPLLKGDANTGTICEIFKNTIFYRTPPVAASRFR